MEQDSAPIDKDLFGSGKADIGSSAKVLEDVALDSTTKGSFEAGVRAYGYEFEAKKGAAVTAKLNTENADGESLDTYMVLYGPAEDGDIGPRIKRRFNGNSLSYEVKENGSYLLAFTTFSNVKSADYSFSLKCDGTDFQCSRPDWEKSCEEKTKYIRGGQDITEDTTWNACNVVLLESTTVKKDATLTISPGVTVKGNFVGEDNGRFGNVRLRADKGTIQASGTEDDPIAFTAKVDEKGWGGLEFSESQGNVFQNVVVEKAQTAFDIMRQSKVEVTDALIQGRAETFKRNKGFDGTAGIYVRSDATATFERAVVKGLEYGIRANGQENLVMRDSIIRDNFDGVFLQTDGHRKDRCLNDSDPEEGTVRDPKIVHTDIVNNAGNGIEIEGDNAFLQVEKSNLVNNGEAAVLVLGTQLAGDSYIQNSNIFANNVENSDDSQIRTYHQESTLRLTDNYWKDTSDPALSNNWRNTCADEGGDINFEGFMPKLIADAGPRKEKCKEQVYQHSFAQTTGE
jgi:hypothetical protein